MTRTTTKAVNNDSKWQSGYCTSSQVGRAEEFIISVDSGKCAKRSVFAQSTYTYTHTPLKEAKKLRK